MPYIKKVIIFISIIASVSGSENKIYPWSLTALLDNNNCKEDEFIFDSSKNINFLPAIDNKSLFESVRDMSICRKSDVRKFIYTYITTGKAYTIKAIERSKIYLEMMNEVFMDNQDIPDELKLLPLLESGFDPMAVSRSNAAGLWQFLSGTSYILGININEWTDERRHIIKSTSGAIRHLKNLYNVFKSWELALAAYNGGAGYVRRAMIKTGTSDFWKLQKTGELRRETSEYVSRFAALLVIYKNPDLFLLDDKIEKAVPVKTHTITFKYPININSLSKISGIPVSAIRMLNPELKRNYTPPIPVCYSMRMPASSIKRIMAKIDKLYKIKFRKIKRHIVKKGDNVNKIARRYKTKPSMIIILNGIKKPYNLHMGEKLYIPI